MGSKGGVNWTYECSCDTKAHSFTGAATGTDMYHNFPRANIILTRVMSKHSHTLIIFLIDSLPSLGFSDSPLLVSIYLVGLPFLNLLRSFLLFPSPPFTFHRALGLTWGLLFNIHLERKKKSIKMPSGAMVVTSEWSKSLISLPTFLPTQLPTQLRQLHVHKLLKSRSRNHFSLFPFFHLCRMQR